MCPHCCWTTHSSRPPLTNNVISQTLRQFVPLSDRCGGMFSDIIAHFFPILTVKQFRKLVIFDEVKAHKTLCYYLCHLYNKTTVKTYHWNIVVIIVVSIFNVMGSGRCWKPVVTPDQHVAMMNWFTMN